MAVLAQATTPLNSYQRREKQTEDNGENIDFQKQQNDQTFPTDRKWDYADSSDPESFQTPETNQKQPLNESSSKTSSPVSVDDYMMNIWIDVTLNNLGKDNWIAESITKTERYLDALYLNTEYRIMLTNHLSILRSGSDTFNKPNVLSQYARFLKQYASSKRQSKDRMGFLKSVRVLNLSPSGT